MARWRWLVSSCLIALPALSSADEPRKPVCKGVEATAKLIMSYRQRGVSMSNIVDMIDRSPGTMNKTAKEIAVSAFEAPIYDDLGERDVAQSEFENKWYLKCYKESGS